MNQVVARRLPEQPSCQLAGIPGDSLRPPACVPCGMSGILSTMRVQVLFFGQLKDLTGRSVESLPLGDQATARDVLRHYSEKYPSIVKLASSLALSINQEYAAQDAPLHDGDEVALL